MSGYQHAEAFCLMTYRADDGSETETIWNSRDGVTPFIITLPSGKTAKHVNWSGDVRDPDYIPPAGSRVFIDDTADASKARAKEMAKDYWRRNYLGCRTQFGSAKHMAKALDQWQPGAPDLVTAEEYLAGIAS